MSGGKEPSVDLKLSPLSDRKILDNEGSAPKAVPEDTSDIGLGEDGMPLNPNGGEPGVQFTSPGRDPINGDAKVEIGAGSGVPHFVGLGKEELMKYANDPFWVRLRWFLFALFWLIWLAMLVGAIVIIVLAPKCQNKEQTMGQTIVAKNGPYYQVFLKSFTPDGKLPGLEEKITYIKSLNMKTVIISQFLETKDRGSGISEVVNFETIDPSYGLDFEGFTKLVSKFKDAGLGIILQFIPNHSSKSHPWFNSKPNYYVLKKKSDIQNANWTSAYEQKAWSARNASDIEGDWYLHQFLEGEADLNYKNSEVVQEMNRILKHWYSTGVDGFLFSDVSYLSEDLDKLGNDQSNKNQDDNVQIIESLVDSKSWNLEKREPPYVLLDLNDMDSKLIFEMFSKDNLVPVSADWASLPKQFSEKQLKDISDTGEFVLRRLSGPRFQTLATQFGTERANILAMITFMLRGEVVLYYGDEIGLESLDTKPSSTNLDISTRNMDWGSADAITNKRLAFYLTLTTLHKNMNQTLQEGGTTKFYTATDVFAFKRDTIKKYVVITNVGGSEQKINLKESLGVTEKATVVLVTPDSPGPELGVDVNAEEITIHPLSGIVLELDTE